MSQTNVELLRVLYEAWNRGKARDEVLSFIAEDFEFVNPHYAVEPGTRTDTRGGCRLCTASMRPLAITVVKLAR